MKNYKLYIVGGYVRDKLLGLKSKDIDYAFEFNEDFIKKYKNLSPSDFYIMMNIMLKNEGFEIFLETPSCFTTRAKFPKGHINENLTADFVLCRKEVYLDENTRQPSVEIGNLYDDLERRDFKINAIAEDENGNLIDPFDGIKDIERKILKCPIDAQISFNNDPLRMLRAIRFCVTKDFYMDDDIDAVIRYDEKMWVKFEKVVSRERVRDEIYKMMRHNSIESMRLLTHLDNQSSIDIIGKIFKDDLWLEPTTKKK